MKVQLVRKSQSDPRVLSLVATMPAVLKIARLEDTTLWKRLRTGFADSPHGQDAEALSVHVKELCSFAYDRMKAFPSLHPEFTLHDECHLLRVTQLMVLLLRSELLHSLNPVEIALLILS